LHAFDLDKVAGGTLTVRQAGAGEQVETLDGQTHRLDPDMVLIGDADGPTSIAGVMGGARSEVSGETTRVLLEVASWNGPNIHRTAQKLALRSEASSRFAKGLAPEQAMEAQAVATQLMLELTGARLVEGTIDVGDFTKSEVEATVLRLPAARVAEVLGMPIEVSEQSDRLSSLGFGVEGEGDALAVTVPAFRRGDVTREADLIEEVGRFSLDSLPATLPKRRGAAGRLPRALQLRRRALDALVDRGAHEIVGWSFANPQVADRLRLEEGSTGRKFVTLENPMSDEHSVLRTSLIGSLLDAASHNVARGSQDLTLAEQGAVYLQTGGGLPAEHHALGCLQTGRTRPVSWGAGQAPAPADVFTIKALVEAVLGVLRVPFTVEQAEAPFLHPGRSAKVLAGETVLGWLGELHPLVAESWELQGSVAAFELDMDAVVAHAVEVPRFRDLTSFPAVRQDLAIVLDDERTAAEVLAVIDEAGGELLRSAELFDVYRGPQVGEGQYSVAIALTFQAEDRTLTQEDVAPAHARIVEALASIGGELRS
jgi:phenylalanyl-tRNA synthetase beta chain